MAKSKLTNEVRNTIVEALEAGNYDKAAFEAAGISERTFYRWLEDGEKAQSGKMRQFWQDVTRARGVGESKAVTAISEAGAKDWRAYAWLLERRHSSRWANTQKVELQLEKEFETMLGMLEESLDPHEFRKVAGVLAGSRQEA